MHSNSISPGTMDASEEGGEMLLSRGEKGRKSSRDESTRRSQGGNQLGEERDGGGAQRGGDDWVWRILLSVLDGL